MTTHRILALVFLSTIAPLQLHAQETISGFQKYQFGMSLEEIMNISNLTIQEASDPETLSYDGDDVRIMGEDFAVQLTFKDERLWNINVARMAYKAGSVQCEGDFDKAFASMQANYGYPDSPPDKQDPMDMSACFTAQDASRACVISLNFAVLESCSLIVTYSAPPEGGGF